MLGFLEVRGAIFKPYLGVQNEDELSADEVSLARELISQTAFANDCRNDIIPALEDERLFATLKSEQHDPN